MPESKWKNSLLVLTYQKKEKNLFWLWYLFFKWLVNKYRPFSLSFFLNKVFQCAFPGCPLTVKHLRWVISLMLLRFYSCSSIYFTVDVWGNCFSDLDCFLMWRHNYFQFEIGYFKLHWKPLVVQKQWNICWCTPPPPKKKKKRKKGKRKKISYRLATSSLNSDNSYQISPLFQYSSNIKET